MEGFKASSKEAESNKESALWTVWSWQNSLQQWGGPLESEMKDEVAGEIHCK